MSRVAHGIILLALAALAALVVLAEPADAQTVTLTASTTTPSEGIGTIQLTATCTPAVTQTCPATTVNLAYSAGAPAATSGADYTPVSSIAIGAGTLPNTPTSASVSLPILADTADEPDEKFTVSISSAGTLTVGSPSSQTVTIVDDDTLAPPVQLQPQTGTPCSSDGWTAIDNVAASDDAYATATQKLRSFCKDLTDIPADYNAGVVNQVLVNVEQKIQGYGNDEWKVTLSIGTTEVVSEFVAGSPADTLRTINATAARPWTIGDLNAARITVASHAIGPADGTWAVDRLWLTATINRPPVPTTTALDVTEDVAKAAHVAATDADGNPVAYALVAQPLKGVITGFNSITGAFTYTPAQDVTGTDSFQYTVSDGQLSATGTVAVTIAAVNDAPTVTVPAAQTFNEDTVRAFTSANGNLLSISDVDAGSGLVNVTVSVTAGKVDLNAAAEAPLSFTCSGCSTDGDQSTTFQATVAQANQALRGMTFTPAQNGTGSPYTTLTLTVSDLGNTGSGGALSRSANVALNVAPINDEPLLAAIPAVAIAEDSPAQAVELTGIAQGGGPDEAAQTLTITATSDNLALVPNPSVTYTSPGATGSLAFTPVANASGTATITVTLKDSGSNTAPHDNSTTRTFTVTVTAVNDAPTMTIPTAAQSTTEDNARIFSTANGNAITVSDVDAAANPVRVNLTAPAGTRFTLAAGSGTTFDCPSCSADGDNVTTFQGTLLQVNAALNGLGFYGPSNTAGSYNITLVADDLGNTGQGGAHTVSKELGVTVTGLNDAPTNVIPAAQTMLEDTVLVLRTADGNALSTADVDAAPGTVRVTLTATQGTLTLPATGGLTFLEGDGTTDPKLDFVGSLSNVNLRLDGLRYAPAANFFGAASITMLVNDTGNTGPGGYQSDSDTLAITVTGINDPPTIGDVADQATNEDQPRGPVAVAVGDLETPAGSLVMTGSSSNTALVPNGNIAFGGSGASRTVTVTPAHDQVGTATISITVTDANGGTATDTFGLVVHQVADVPTISDTPNQGTTEDAPKVVTVTIGDGETPASALVLTATSSDATLLPNANIAISGTGASRTLTLTPAAHRSGTTTITVTVKDSSQRSASDTFVLAVSAVNDAPTLDDAPDLALAEDAGPQTVDLLGISRGGGTDESSQTLTVTATSDNTALVPNPTVTYTSPGTTGSLAFTPAANGFGTATISVRVTDSGSNVAPNANTFVQTFMVTVGSANDPPTITPISDQSIAEDGLTAALPFTVGDVETASGSLTLSGASSNQVLVPNGNIVFGGSGASRTVTVTPAADESGVATITVNVSDGTGTVSEPFLLTVASIDDAPTITVPTDLAITEDAGWQTLPLFGIGPGGGGPESGQTLVLTATSNNTDLIPDPTLARTGTTGTLSFTPTAQRSGLATITVKAVDSGSAVAPNANTTTKVFQVTVATINDVPTISHLEDVTLDEDGSTGARAITLGDVETAPDDLIVTRASSNLALVPLANIAIAGSGPERTVTVAPLANQSGAATVTLTVADGDGAASTTSFDLTILSVPDVPLADDDSYEVLQGASINVPASAGVLEGDADAEEDPLTANLVAGPTAAQGVLAFASNGSFTFTPAPSFLGAASFTYRANDTSSESNLATVTLNVRPDGDDDGHANVFDNCPTKANADQADGDGDNIGDVCDANQQDGPLGDRDGDGAANSSDNCPNRANPDQADSDGDGLGNQCDSTPNGPPAPPQPRQPPPPPPPPVDSDGDGKVDPQDNCPALANSDQADGDGDGKGNACDANLTDGPLGDGDGDGAKNGVDNCPAKSNPDQADGDGDKHGDLCDATLNDGPLGDRDGDGKTNAADNCPALGNADQADSDGDGQGDACDQPTSPPARPKDVRATLQQDGSVLVQWNTSNDPTVRLHRVWRASTPVLIGEVPTTAGTTAYSFNDVDFPGGHHEYFVESVRDPSQPAVLGTEAAASTTKLQMAACAERDTDKDGLCDAQEEKLGTDPGTTDTDGDGALDLREIGEGTDPLKPSAVGGHDVVRPQQGIPGQSWLAVGLVALLAAAIRRRT